MSRWEPQKCSHKKLGLAGGCEACYNAHADLTSKASERVTLGAVADDMGARASSAFIRGRDDEARLLRDMAREYRQKAKQASLDQDALIREVSR